MSKLFFRVLLLIYFFWASEVALADSLAYDRESISDYFLKRDSVLFVVKTGGGIPYEDFEGYIKEYNSGSVGKVDLYSIWNRQSKNYFDDFVILKSLAGDQQLGERLRAHSVSSYKGLAKLAGSYLILLSKDGEGYKYGVCDIFPLNKLPNDIISQELAVIVDYISRSHITPCLYDEGFAN